MTKPNIVFIILDTLRADRIKSNYSENSLTPFLSSLLPNSIYFENCISNTPWTLPSHISMFTGLYPTQTTLISKKVDRISNKTPILTEILKDIGYFTCCFTENAFISKTFSLTRGFDKVFNVWDWNPWLREKYILSKFIIFLNKVDLVLKKKLKFKIILKLWTYFKERCEILIKKIIKCLFLKDIIFKLKNNTINDLEKFNQFLQNLPSSKPLYLFFNFITVHDPYIPLKETFPLFNITYDDFKNISSMIINPLETRLEIDIKSKLLPNKKVKTIQKLYDACVFSSDIVIKKLFSILNKNELLNNSFIIITSDHGEHLCDELDHSFWEHNTYQSVYRSLMKVPLLIYNKNWKARLVNDQVQLKDLFHTILHLTGIKGTKNKYLNIKSSILSQIDNHKTPKYIFGEYLKSKEEMTDLINAHRKTINKNLIPKIFNHIYFLRSNKFKYIKYNNIKYDEFFDLSADPYEKNNLFDTKNEKCSKFKLKFENLLNEISNIGILKDIITKKEKDSLKRSINNIKINGI